MHCPIWEDGEDTSGGRDDQLEGALGNPCGNCDLGQDTQLYIFPDSMSNSVRMLVSLSGGTLFGNLCFFLNVCELVNAHV